MIHRLHLSFPSLQRIFRLGGQVLPDSVQVPVAPQRAAQPPSLGVGLPQGDGGAAAQGCRRGRRQTSA